MKNNGKVPPQALDIEQDVLGALLLDREGIYKIDFLKPEMFYNPHYQVVFKAILELSNERLPIDLHTVSERLKSFGKLDEVGGYYLLAELTGRIASASHLEYHAAILFQKWYARELIKICTEVVYDSYNEQKDIVDVKASLDTALIKLDEFEQNNTEDLTEKLHKVRKTLRERQNAKQKGIKTAYRTPLKNLNKLMNGGFHKGDLFILAARPAMGKTRFASEFAECLAEDSPGAFFSLEMTDEQLINRMFTKSGAVMYNLMNGTMNDDDWLAVDKKSGELSKLHNITIKDDVYSLYKIGNIARKLKREKQLEWLIIDYLGLIEVPEKNETRNLEIGKITRYLKKMAKELDIPIILLSQLNRNEAGKRPVLTDLRESGNIEQDADGVLFIHRPTYYRADASDEDGISWHNRGELILSKYRHGMTGTAVFEHDDTFSNFWDYQVGNHNNPENFKIVNSWEVRNTHESTREQDTPF